MKAVIGLQLMLIGVCCGVESSCNARKKDVRCFGALGGTVNLRIMDTATTLPEFIWAKQRSQLFHWMSQKIVARTEDNRFSFFPHNGIVKITNLRRHDSGLYQLVVFKEGRKRKVIRTLKLFIEAPVSSPWLDSQCMMSGMKRFICFSQKQGNYFCKWTMNRKPLKNSKYFSGYANKMSKPYYGHDKTCSIYLLPKAIGHLGCFLQNHISYSFIQMWIINTCAIERWYFQLPKKKKGANKPTVPRKPSKNKKGQKKNPKVPPKPSAKETYGVTTPTVPPKTSFNSSLSTQSPKEKDEVQKPTVPPTPSLEKNDGAEKPTVPANPTFNPSLSTQSPKENDGAEKLTVPPTPSPKEKDGAKKPKVPPKTSPKEKDEVKKPTVPPTPSPEKNDGAEKPKVPQKLSLKDNDGAEKPTVPAKPTFNPSLSTQSPKENDGAEKPTVPPTLSPKENDGAEKPTVPPTPSLEKNDGAEKPKVPPKPSPKEKDEVKTNSPTNTISRKERWGRETKGATKTVSERQ
ncbi:uncharacterized protein LOC129379226 isoform X16 [Poeciliopsis prolifica]|uniref:uncharacterized protein LOC129379226 isoform X16 n=1 Tax=Poeciliopsis prolifica TaxID=188132 RepID=UPI002413FA2E|nr:uncharacterized protein LOC129379226 isoform X16 [Poeciliopsis prolifica]